MENLEKSCNCYQEKFQERLAHYTDSTGKSGSSRQAENLDVFLNELVNDLEKGSEFKELTHAIRVEFLKDGYHGDNESFWEYAVRQFLRRSKYYIEVAEGKTPTYSQFNEKLKDAFRKQTRKVTYLAPMEYVQFGGDPMEFRLYSIRRFTYAELEEILENSIRKIFYPSYYVEDLELLSSYWFIVVSDEEKIWPLGNFDFKVPVFGNVSFRYSRYPAIEIALQELTLIDWEENWGKWSQNDPSEWMQWERFSIPFGLRVTDNLLEHPGNAPALSRLATEPWIHPETGEVEGEMPDIRIYWDTDQTQSFQSYLKNIDQMFESVKANTTTWPFFERALGFLVKAFFSYELEQLLWHMAALEAVLGENKPGLTRILADRIGRILGNTKDEQKKIRKKFRALYDFRSDLVHGDEFEEQIREGHLNETRGITRQVMVWFLHYLASIEKGLPQEEKPQGLLKRNELLQLIDLEESSRTRLSKFITKVSPDFPHVPSWHN